jgi:hypothetical protein
VIEPDRQYMGERDGERISPPVGRQNSIRICGAHTLDRPYAWSRAQIIGP